MNSAHASGIRKVFDEFCMYKSSILKVFEGGQFWWIWICHASDGYLLFLISKRLLHKHKWLFGHSQTCNDLPEIGFTVMVLMRRMNKNVISLILLWISNFFAKSLHSILHPNYCQAWGESNGIATNCYQKEEIEGLTCWDKEPHSQERLCQDKPGQFPNGTKPCCMCCAKPPIPRE